MNQRKFTRNKSKKKTNKPIKSFFMKLRKKIYERTIKKKYGDPYIKILIPKDEIIEKEQIPKYNDLYKTNKLITKSAISTSKALSRSIGLSYLP